MRARRHSEAAVGDAGHGRPQGPEPPQVRGAPEAESEDPAVLESEIRSRLARGERPKEIADALSTTHPKRDVYQLALKLKK